CTFRGWRRFSVPEVLSTSSASAIRNRPVRDRGGSPSGRSVTPSVTAGGSPRSGKLGFRRRTTRKPGHSAPEDRGRGWQRSPGPQQAGDGGGHLLLQRQIDRRRECKRC